MRRRTKLIGRFPGEQSCLSLCWALLDLVISHANGVTVTDVDRAALDRLAGDRRHNRTTGEEVTAA